jgi:hypothetical protein
MNKKQKKLRKLSIVVFDPWYGKKNPKAYSKHPIKIGEQVLYLGDIPNCPGHCAVAKYTGEVVWMVHPDEFREAKDSEL